MTEIEAKQHLQFNEESNKTTFQRSGYVEKESF